MEVEKLVVGQLQTNCYLVWDEETREAVIIDPGDDGDYLIRRIQDLNLKPKLIAATHGHFDHVLAVTELKLAYKIPFLIHEKDLFLLKRSSKTSLYFTGIPGDPVLPVEGFVKEGDLIQLGRQSLKVIETPGHTPGGISLYQKGVLFSGDTVFCQGFGRTDFAYSSEEKLRKSIKKLLKLPKNTVVYPGHGTVTTVGAEKGPNSTGSASN